MAKKSVFVSFDYDNDHFLKVALVGQSDLADSPFSLTDSSIKEHLVGDWKEKAKNRIKNVDLVTVICGENTHKADGVSAELTIAKELGKPYFLLKGYGDKKCTFPASAHSTDKMYNWTWDNLKNLIGGGR